MSRIDIRIAQTFLASQNPNEKSLVTLTEELVADTLTDEELVAGSSSFEELLLAVFKFRQISCSWRRRMSLLMVLLLTDKNGTLLEKTFGQSKLRQVDEETPIVTHCKRKGVTYIGRPSVWGNPYKLRNNSRLERMRVVFLFFKDCLQGGKKLSERVHDKLSRKLLGCFCIHENMNMGRNILWLKPCDMICHGQVLAWFGAVATLTS